LDLHWWPIFNVADMAIVCGGFLLAWHVYRMERSDING